MGIDPLLPAETIQVRYRPRTQRRSSLELISVRPKRFVFPAANTYAADPTGILPEIMNFSLSVQRRLLGGTIVYVAYTGSLGRNLQWQRNINSIPVGTDFR